LFLLLDRLEQLNQARIRFFLYSIANAYANHYHYGIHTMMLDLAGNENTSLRQAIRMSLPEPDTNCPCCRVYVHLAATSGKNSSFSVTMLSLKSRRQADKNEEKGALRQSGDPAIQHHT